MTDNSVIEMHDTWLVINSIIGCTNGCKYCFLQAKNQNISKPQIKVSEKEAVNQLLNYKYYEPNIPVCLLPNTDPFLNKTNIKYLQKLLKLLSDYKITNPITIITKCLIPDYFISYLQKLKKDNLKIIIYLSFSGLSKELEPNINDQNIKNNFQKLSQANIPIIHYFRPFIPQNSNPEKITEILNFVNKYTDISVITGLKIKQDFVDKINFWDYISTNKTQCINSSGIWPREAYDFFYKNYHHSQKIYQINSCALAAKLNLPNESFYNTKECLNYNHCSDHQRKKCLLAKKTNEPVETKLIALLKKINKYNPNLVIIKKDNSIVLKNIDLTTGDVSYLTFMLGYKITIAAKLIDDNYFNSSYTNAESIII